MVKSGENENSGAQGAGRVVLLGAGPGDPELMTIRGLRLLRKAGAVVYDRLIPSELLRYCRGSAELVYVGKRAGAHCLEQARINDLLADLAGRHSLVVRLKGGDPFVFGRGGEEYRYLTERGIACEIVPGVTAACAAAAQLRVPLTDREHASRVEFVTGHPRAGGKGIDFTGLDPRRKTCVIYMGLKALPELAAQLLRDPANAHVPVAVVENASRPGGRCVKAPLGEIASAVEAAAIQSPALILLGGTLYADHDSPVCAMAAGIGDGEREAKPCSP